MKIQVLIPMLLIYDYILELKESARLDGRSEIVLVARDIGRHFGRLDRIVMVCNAMYRAMNEGDVVVHTTASGFSTTSEIKYRLN